MIYTVTFNPSLDYVMHVPTLNVGGVSRAVRESIFPGGKGINVAVVLEQLGFATTALGFYAGYTGKAMLSMLAGHISHTDFIELPAGQSRINVKVKSTQESDINGHGPQVSAEQVQKLLAKLDPLQAGDVLVLSGAVSAGVSADIYGDILRRVDGRGVLCVVDAVGPLLQNALPFKPFLIKPNEAELAHLFGVEIKTEEDLILYAHRAQQLGAQQVLVSRGAKGAVLVSHTGQVFRAPALALPGPVVNSVGAGDSMVAGFLAGWLQSHSEQKALQWALAAGGACVMKEWLPTRADIVSLLS